MGGGVGSANLGNACIYTAFNKYGFPKLPVLCTMLRKHYGAMTQEGKDLMELPKTSEIWIFYQAYGEV